MGFLKEPGGPRGKAKTGKRRCDSPSAEWDRAGGVVWPVWTCRDSPLECGAWLGTRAGGGGGDGGGGGGGGDWWWRLRVGGVPS
ncbi:hypothetical protein IAQ61_009772 [Plenodomus lingam]|uniref:uncharacterized protein n=1 Tax=Leptosphaeria maculans TaxID=5022 RepID=UPI00332C8068|nr:hypothetical protein IAQ61_009772 [Plenodomus lingam]